jgi:Na+/melibiose symporter-like transporter
MLTKRTWIALILLGFAGQLAWGVENQYFNAFVYDKITPDPRPISWMVAASAVVATLTAILMGALSDRTRTRWGRRRPFILFGYLAWGIATAAFPTAARFQPIALAVFLAIAFDCLMTYFGATANDAALNAYVADVTTGENRGRVVGAMQIMTWVALLIVYGGAGLIIAGVGYDSFFYFIGGLVLVLGLVGGWLIREPPVTERSQDSYPQEGVRTRSAYWAQIADTFHWQSLASNRDFFLVLLAIALWGVAEQIFFPYLIIYLNHYLKLPTLNASLLIFIAILIGGIVLAYPLGLLADRLGRRRVAFLAIAAEAVGLFLWRAPIPCSL